MAEAAHAHAHGHEHAEEKKKLSPKFEVSDAGPCKLKIAVEVSADKVKELIDDKYRELSESVALPGFRKGHAPRNLLERKFGKALLDDLKFELLNHSFEEIKEERKLEPVGEPDIEVEKLAVEEGKPFAFDLTIEVRPTFELKGYEGIKVRKPAIVVPDTEVEAVLRGYQESKAELVPVDDGVAQEHHQIIADFLLKVGDKTIDQAENQALFLDPDITFYGVKLPDFHTSVAGHKAGDSVDVKVTLPADFADAANAGKEADLRVSLKSVKKKQLPEINAEFLKSFDMDTLEEFQEWIRKRIVRDKESQAQGAMSDQIVEELIRINDFPMPEGLVVSGTEESMRRLHLDLAMKGMAEEEIARTVETERGQSRGSMEKALRAHFILDHIAQKEKIFVTEDQVEEKIQQLASQFGKWPHEMKAYLEQQGLVAQLRRRMREELVREYLLSKAVIEEEKSGGA